MAECECGNQFPDKRKQLGFHTCLSCGEKLAQEEIERKRTRIMPAGNKMGYTLLSGDVSLAKQQARGFARKTEER